MHKIARLFVCDESQNRNNNINVIRWLAAAMVIYGHMAHLTGGAIPEILGTQGHSIAVKIFFVLSGYLICQSLFRDKDLFRYGVRRVFRIVPGLIFVCFMWAFVLGPLLSSLSFGEYFSTRQPLRYFVLNCLLSPVYNLPGVFVDNFYPNAVNGSLWTLPVEFSMYIILPILVLPISKLNRGAAKWACLGFAVFTLVIQLIHTALHPEWSFVIWGTDVFQGMALVPFFFAGAFLSFAELEKYFNLQVSALLALVAGVACFSSAWIQELLVFCTLPYIVMSCSLAKPAVFGRLFAEHDYSYGLYLWGFPVQQALVMLFGPKAFGLTAYALICIVVTMACAMVSWHLVERPASMLGKRITNWSKNRSKAKQGQAVRSDRRRAAHADRPQPPRTDDMQRETAQAAGNRADGSRGAHAGRPRTRRPRQ